MPYDEHGNLSTPLSVTGIRTLKDVIDDGKDVVPLTVGGVATVAKDTGTGVELTKKAPAGP